MFSHIYQRALLYLGIITQYFEVLDLFYQFYLRTVLNTKVMASVVSILSKKSNLMKEIQLLLPKLSLHVVENPGKYV